MVYTTGGPAFPMLGSVAHDSDWMVLDGMTLRDYFAAAAMQNMIGCQVGIYPFNAAKTAYSIADAMLKEREAK